MLVGSADNADGVSGAGFYYFTSDDLINWSMAKLLMNAELPWTYQCQDGPEQLRDPSLLDNDSTSRNFDTIGQRPFLFFTRFNVQFNNPTSCLHEPRPRPDPDPGRVLQPGARRAFRNACGLDDVGAQAASR